jgi:hypothetical protein
MNVQSTETNARILWVQDEYNGPLNGLIEYQGSSLWFTRNNVEPNSDIHYSMDRSVITETYSLYRLPPSVLDQVIHNHRQYCAVTGAPLNHGDPKRIKRGVTPKRSAEYKHTIIPVDVVNMGAELVSTVTSAQITNLILPRSIILE